MPVQQELRRGGCRNADEPDPHARALNHRIGRQRERALAVDRVGRDVGVGGARVVRGGGVHEPAVRVALERRRGPSSTPAQHPDQLVAALVELVVPERPHVEAELVAGLHGRFVVEPARDQRRGADHVARVHADGSARNRRAVEVRLQPGRAAEPRPRRLQVPVEVVHAEQPHLHEAAGLARLGRRRGVGARVQAEERDRDRGDERGHAGQEASHALDAKSLQIAGCYALCAVA